jgi:hypothetical protein
MKSAVFLFAILAAVGMTRGEGVAVLVPAYFSPATGYWNDLAQAARRVPLVAIANIFNGPGSDTKPRADYLQAIRAVRDAGGQVVGYVYTQYGERAAEVVQSDIRRWQELYPVDGFFVDEMANTPNTLRLDYYAALAEYIRSLNANYQIIGNPGTNTEEAYATRKTADVFTIFENGTGYTNFAPAAWTQRYPTHHFATLLYAVADADAMQTNLNLAAAKRAGYIYITDDTLSNPWNRLPTYWSAEVAAIELINREAARRVLTNLTIQAMGTSSANVQSTGATGRYVLETGFPNQWTPIATNLTPTGAVNWPITNLTLPANRLFRTRQD